METLALVPDLDAGSLDIIVVIPFPDLENHSGYWRRLHALSEVPSAFVNFQGFFALFGVQNVFRISLRFGCVRIMVGFWV